MRQEVNEFLRIKSKPKYFIFLIIYFFLFPISKLLYGRKNRWIICERKSEAQDNGYIFYKYLKSNHPEIKPFYIIDKNCADAKKFGRDDKLINYGSLSHLMAAIGSRVCISTQLFGYAPWIVFATYLRRKRVHNKHIFLQHGIIKNDHRGLHGDVCKSLDIFICGAFPEFRYISEKFEYYQGVPKYTGLARYDLLPFNLTRTKDQILIMPTWRANLRNLTKDDFYQSDFYREWNKILTNKMLLDACRSKRLKIKFYLHHEMQQFSDLFNSNDVVDVLKYGELTVQQLLIDSKLLITDFSSVYFDFAYMGKPEIFFQFDEATFNTNHYEKGYFDYRKDGFGDVLTNSDNVIESIKKYIENGFQVEEFYSRKTKDFFHFHDSNNCQRIYEAIESLLK